MISLPFLFFMVALHIEIQTFISRTYKTFSVKDMVMYSKEEIRCLQHSIYKVFLRDPRAYYHEGAEQCRVQRTTFSKYWRKGLKDQVLFSPQIRLKMYKDRKEYIYLIQNDKANELYKYYQNQPNVVYLAYTLGRFDLLVQTSRPLEVIPDSTLLYGSRSNYMYPETPYYSFKTAFDKMKSLLNQSHEPSHIQVTYPVEPEIKGAKWGRMVFPYLKYNLRTNYTFIVKTLGISFSSFYSGFDYLLKVSAVLLPFYPFGMLMYRQYFLVFWTQYANLVCEFFSCLPCHVSITKVDDALLIYASCISTLEHRLFALCYQMLERGLIERFWTSAPLYHWVPNP